MIKVSCSRIEFTNKPDGIGDRIVERDCWKQRVVQKGFLVLTSRSKNKWFFFYFSILICEGPIKTFICYSL